MHSNPRQPGDLAEKRLRYEILESRRKMLATDVQKKLETVSKAKILQENIKLTKQRIKCLNHIIREKTESTKKIRQDCDKLRLENEKRTQRLPQFGSKVNKIDQYTRQHVASLDHLRLKINQKWKALCLKRREHIQELTQLIFPIDLVDVDVSRKSSDVAMDDAFDEIMAEMEDAMSTSYIHGRWVTTSMNDG